MTMTTNQVFANVTELKEAIKFARDTAKREARKDCGRGFVMSRGAFIKIVNAKGDLIQGECDTWEFTGTAKQFRELADLLRYGSACSIYIEGGFNFAESLRDYADGAYDPLVSEWSVEFGSKVESQSLAEMFATSPATADADVKHLLPQPQVGQRSTTFQPVVGQRVRSYDFPHRDDCYVEGTVLRVEGGNIFLMSDAIVREGQSLPQFAGREMVCPVNGLTGSFSGRLTNGVTPA